MPSRSPPEVIAKHFKGKAPTVAATYAALLRAAQTLGPFREDAKKTSIHLVRESAFAGVAARKSCIILTLKAAADLDSPRILRRERASANRWHLDVRLEAPGDVDSELRRWLAAAYAMSG